MTKFILVILTVPFFVSSCDREPEDVQTFKSKNTHTLLDLRITPETIQKIETTRTISSLPDKGGQTPVILDLTKKHKETRINFNGELFYDKVSDNYLKSIDGGIINLEFKFR